MLRPNRSRAGKVLALLVVLAGLAHTFSVKPLMAQQGQPIIQNYAATLESKLLQKATFIPTSKSALEQLIEVAQHYHLPMGIEWNSEAKSAPAVNPLLWLKDNATVQDLINAILQQSPDHHLTLERGVVHISQPELSAHPKNFLNLRIKSFDARQASLFSAEFQLRNAIHNRLYPEDFKDGFNGGYGSPHPHVFEAPNVTFSGNDLTVLEILDGIAVSNGNALWMAVAPASEFMIDKPPAKSEDEREYRASFAWSFTPLKELEIKEEKVVVELSVKDCLQEKESVPVVFDEGRLASGGGGGGGGSYPPPPCSYSVEVTKIRKDRAVVNLTVRGTTEYGAPYEVKKSLPVTRGRINSYRFDHGIKVKTYVEPEKDSDH
jgi:hypothetical protein